MAVYTKISEPVLHDFINAYDIGALQAYEGIQAGVSNTNYHVFTEKGRYVLTLFEPHRVNVGDVPFFAGYADHLAKFGLPAPAIIKTKEGKRLRELKNRPAILSEFLHGEDVKRNAFTPAHCRAAGELLGRMHKAGDDYQPVKGNDYSLDRWEDWGRSLKLNEIKRGLKALVEEELKHIKHHWPHNMQGGAIHGDFFPDNVFFKDGEVSGLIDFHFACTDFYIYDVAIAINAWCFDDDAVFKQARYDALIEGYQSIQKLDKDEWHYLPFMLRAAALRFVLSRAEEFLSYKEGDEMTPHDPHAFIKRLEHFRHE